MEEIATGEASGTWGTKTNTSLELIGEALGFGTEAITTNADTHSSTIADGATDPVRAMFVKYTGTLDSTCTITIAPNTINRFHIIENATSGSQSIIIKQGSGATVTIPTGQTSAVYLDGAGSGAAVVDAFTDLSLAGTFNAAGDIISAGTVQATGDTAAGDGAAIGFTSAEGLILTGQGSTNDVTIKNDADADVLEIPTGTTNVTVAGDITAAGTLNVTGDTAAGDDAAIGFTSAEGLILTGQGSTNDVTIKNDNDADVLEIPTGTTNVTIVGDLTTAGTLQATGDTAAGDGAAIGFTSTEGIIITGQGSTNDVTIKNDADADVIEIPTGTTNVTVAGTLTAGGILKTDDTTEATSTTDGSLQTDGGLSVAKDAVFGDDVKLLSDSSVLAFGADGDVTLTHAADTSLTCNLMMAATTFEPSADTAAGDNAAIGFTSAEGLILTGQGSTNDVTVKNDADADVIKVPTGTTNVEIVGNLTVGGSLSGVGGKVLQVVQAIEQRSSNASSAGTSYSNVTGLTCSITPSASSSKILVQASFYVHTQSQNYSDITLFRDSTNLATMTEARFLNQRGDGDTDNSNNGFGFYGMVNVQILDSPSSTSELDYTFQSKRGDPQNASIFFLSGAVNSIICTEIAG